MTRVNRRYVCADVVWFSGPLSFVTLEAVAAVAFQPHYSYIHNFISDLGIPGPHSPLAWLMNTAFCLQGTLFLLGALLAGGGALFTVLAGANAVGNFLIAAFHSGSAVHAAGAVLAIVGGNAAILAGSSLAGGRHRWASIGLGVFGLLGFALFVVDLQTALLPIGLLERCSVYSITVWQLLTATTLLSLRSTD